MSDGRYTREYFEEAYADRRPSFYAPILADVIRLGRPGRIVDLGAGTGLFVELAVGWHLEVMGLEGSATAIGLALERSPDLPIGPWQFGAPLPFTDGSVDNLVLNQVIEHVDATVAFDVLKECARVLSEDGRLFVYSPSRRNRYERTVDPTHVHLMLPSALAALISSVGLEVLELPNAGFWFVPRSRVGRYAGAVLLRKLPKRAGGIHDLLSASSNVIARKSALRE